MKVWLIMSGEPLEMFGERPHRIGMLSKILARRGDNVTWWTTTFDHQYKKYVYPETKEEIGVENVNMVFLHSKTLYFKNISLSRIKNHKEVAKEFLRIASNKDKSDIIYCAFPTIDLAYSAVKYAKEHNIPIIIDIRDLWPNIFFDPFPKIIHPFLKILLSDYINKTKYIFSNATALTAVSEKYLNFGLDYGHREPKKCDKVFPLAYHKQDISDEKYLNIEKKFSDMGLDKNKKIVWFVGTFGRTYDLTTVIKGAKDFEGKNVQFVLTGDGEKAKEWKELAKDTQNIIFTGWVNQDDLIYLSSVANIGLMAYRKGAPQGLPNKIFEYMASGLPILSSLGNETKQLLYEEQIGLTYNADDVKSFQKELQKMIDDEALYQMMSKKSLQLYNEHYSAQKVYNDLADYLEKFNMECE